MTAFWRAPQLAAAHAFFGAEANFASAHAQHAEARLDAMQRLATPAPTLFVAKQVHSNRVLEIEADSEPSATALIEADALICGHPGQAVGVLTADCVPVLMHAPKAGYVAAVHAGRVGALAQILTQTVLALEAKGACRQSLQLVVGPHIAASSYEVGQPMHDGLPTSAQWRAEDGRFCCDLSGLLSAEIGELGIEPSQVMWSLEDTLSSPDWHSYRREGAQAGRNLSAIAVGGAT